MNKAVYCLELYASIVVDMTCVLIPYVGCADCFDLIDSYDPIQRRVSALQPFTVEVATQAERGQLLNQVDLNIYGQSYIDNTLALSAMDIFL